MKLLCLHRHLGVNHGHLDLVSCVLVISGQVLINRLFGNFLLEIKSHYMTWEVFNPLTPSSTKKNSVSFFRVIDSEKGIDLTRCKRAFQTCLNFNSCKRPGC